MKNKWKRLLAVWILSSLLPVLPVRAAGAIRIEGENYTSMNFPGSIAGAGDISGGKLLKIQRDFPEGAEWVLEYTVDAPEGGLYTLNIASTKLNFGYTNDYKVQINGGEKIDAKLKATLSSGYSPSIAKDIMGVYYIGTYMLNPGENTIRVIMDKKNDRNAQATFYIDYIELEKAAWGIHALTPRAPVGVFEESGQMLVDIVYTGTPEDKSYTFTVRDYWAALVQEGTMLAKKNTLNDTINLGRLKKGWYKLEIIDNGKVLANTSFSVVPDYAKRTAKDSPFAVDHASPWLTPEEQRPAYAKAIKLAGVNWARERLSWEGVNPKPGEYTYGKYPAAAEVLDQEGVNVIDVYHDSPKWTHPTGNRQLPEDLFTTYEFNKKVVGDLPSVDVWEMWNEEDVTILYLRETAEQYAAHFKAAAIAMAETEQNPYISFGGFSQDSRECEFIDLVFQNGIMDYTSIYNFHNHNGILDTRINESIDLKAPKNDAQIASNKAYDNIGKPVWVTEAGGKMLLESVNEPTNERLLKGQARYVVSSNVQAIAWGVDKNFWFVFPKYIENQADWGTFSEKHTPYPSYQAEAILTYVLGEGKYRGEVKKLPPGVRGYVFNNGIGSDVCVLWSDSNKQMQFKTEQPALLTDFMGNEKTIYPENGLLRVTASVDPVYITFAGEMHSDDFTLELRKEKALERNHFTKEQKIVLNQTYDGIDFIEGKQFGYRKSMVNPFEMQVEVYNFNEEPMEGVIQASAECAVTFDAVEKPVSVGPMEKAVVTFTMRAEEGNLYDTLYDLKFVGVFNGMETSPTVSHISFKYETDLEGIEIPNALNPDKWDPTNVTAGINSWVKAGDNPGEIKIGADMKKQGDWYYPYLDADGALFQQYDGISFWLKCSKELNYDDYGFMNAFVYMDDGAQFFLGNKPVSFDDEWRYFYVTWENWVQFKSGTRGVKVVEPERIRRMSFGFNCPEGMEITVKNPKLFKMPKQEQAPVPEVQFDNVTDGGVITKEAAAAISVTLPEACDPEKTRVVVNSFDFDFPRTISGGKAMIDLSSLPAGYYNLTVISYSSMGYAYDKNVKFYIGG